MRYLFFDIECANCFDGTGKICEFGYVLTDERFNVVEKDQFLIDPKAPFDSYVLDNLLVYDKLVYKNSPNYPLVFKRIQQLFELENLIIAGHTTDADIKYLNDEARRYNLPFFNCKFYDIKIMYSDFAKEKDLGLHTISERLGIDFNQEKHRAMDDAFATMEEAKAMCDKLETNFETLISMSPTCEKETNEGQIQGASHHKNHKADQARANRVRLLQFLDGVQAQGDIVKSELNGKRLSITMNYEEKYPHEMLSIIQLLTNHGCTYGLKASECDYFVTKTILDDDGNERGCSRLLYVEIANEEGANIKIITFEELMLLLGVDEEQLTNMPDPDEKYFVCKNKHKAGGKKREPRNASSISKTATMADLFAGLDLSEFED